MFNNSYVSVFCSSQREREDLEMEYKQKYERERVLLIDENKKLSSEVDEVRFPFLQRAQRGFSDF